MKATTVKSKDKIIKPQPGFQERFAASSVDVTFGGGVLNCGKSFALTLAMAEPLMTDPDFRAVISRKALGSLKAGGGFADTFKEVFGKHVKVRESDSPRAQFESGAFCDLTYIDDSNIDKLKERAKGWQYDFMAIDELTEMTWEAFSYLQTRNRGRSKSFTGKFFATMNPKRSHWTRLFLDWYIGNDGYIIPERDGVIRYFYVNGPSVKDVVWGDSKEEVYNKCKVDIDRKLSKIGGGFGYESMIKSFVFYLGKMAENKAILGTNSGYLGSVAASGGKTAQALLEGNWNVDPDEEDDIPVPSEKARDMFVNDPARNGERWITVDLADFGTDNLVALAWNGFHVEEIKTLSRSSPRENAFFVKIWAQDMGIPEERIIYDATAGRYFNDYIPDAVPYLSATRPLGMYAPTACSMKDLCYMRLVRMINSGHVTIDDRVADTVYKHQNLKYAVTVQNEILEEVSVVRFEDMGGGKRKLLSKKKMNARLGKGRSMDILDPMAMRMLPCIDLQYGSEIDAGFAREYDVENKYNEFAEPTSIYDETLWS